MLRFLTVVMLFGIFAGHALAAPDEMAPQDERLSNSAAAEQHYRTGLRHRDAAWVYEEKRSGIKDEKDRAVYTQFIQKTYQRALEEFKQATELDPKFFQAFSSLGYTYRKTGNLGSALEAYDKALALNPAYMPAVEYRAEAYLELDRVDDVKKAFDILAVEKPPYAARLLTFTTQWANARMAPDERDALLKWVAQKRAQLGDVKEVIEKW